MSNVEPCCANRCYDECIHDQLRRYGDLLWNLWTRGYVSERDLIAAGGEKTLCQMQIAARGG